MKRSQHRDFVNGDVAKTGNKSSLHCRFSWKICPWPVSLQVYM